MYQVGDKFYDTRNNSLWRIQAITANSMCGDYYTLQALADLEGILVCNNPDWNVTLPCLAEHVRTDTVFFLGRPENTRFRSLDAEWVKL